jgi:membrane peptidoglycan carboxypeptidase
VPTIPHIIRIRRRRDVKYRHSPANLIGITGLGFGILLILFGAFAATGLALAYASLTAGLPAPEALPQLLEPTGGLLSEPTRLYDRTGEHEILALENPLAARKQYLPLNEERPDSLSQALVLATIAVADPTFWEHPGFSLQGRILDQKPSLAQRLVVDFLLWEEPPGLRRDLRERLLAAQLTSRYGREKILEWYLNSADYGNYAYGADAAARAYLDKPASQLNLSEAALLAAVSEAPALNPWAAPQAAREREREVLETMGRLGSIDPEELQKSIREEVIFQPSIVERTRLAPAFTALVLEHISSRIDPDRLARGGFKVLTTLDYDLQQQAACAAEAQAARLAGLQAESLQAVDDFSCLAARLLPTEPGAARRTPGEISANVVVLDPGSGQVLAMVGEDGPGLNAVRPPGRPPGTLLTPFIYLTAFTRGWSPASLAWDIPSKLPEEWAGLQNPDRTFHGPQRLRMALANEYLVPAAQLLAEIGEGQVWSMAQQLGLAQLESEKRQDGARPSIDGTRQRFLGGFEITLLEASQAFGVFANKGLLVGQLPEGRASRGISPLQAITVLKVLDSKDRVWLDCTEQASGCQIQSRPVINAQLAYLVTHILSDEPARWPSLGHPNPLEIGRLAGAKIGRTFDGQDAWTVGFTPHLVAGVWLGAHEAGETVSPNAAAGLWHAVMQYAARDLAPEGWSAPPGISRVTVCDPSGMLPTEHCPVVVEEVFLNGTEPTHTDGLFRAYPVNRESGRLATVFTPPGLVEDRVYMILPSDAGDWAETAGLQAPPQTYDVIEGTMMGDEDVRISSPQMFATVSGQVAFTGRADAEGFEYFRVQVGEGLNPPTWLQIVEDVEKPVSDGQLGEWDTSGLNGLYTVQLLVVAEEQRVETATVQVTVDNQPPEVSIRYPLDGQHFTYPDENQVTLQAEASDELSLASVEFILDGETVASLSIPPYAVPWQARLGSHRLLVRAYDQAGNTGEAAIEFVVERK